MKIIHIKLNTLYINSITLFDTQTITQHLYTTSTTLYIMNLGIIFYKMGTTEILQKLKFPTISSTEIVIICGLYYVIEAFTVIIK